VFHQIEARYPASLFKQQLVDQVEKVYGVISDKIKKELNPLLELCIQVPHFLSKAIIHCQLFLLKIWRISNFLGSKNLLKSSKGLDVSF
jgi:hypothetical protein